MHTLSEQPVRIDPFHLYGQKQFIIRDDLIHPVLNGNKARKFFTLVRQPAKTLQKIISWGGVQSNAMFAISWICKLKGWEFEYYTKTPPKWLINAPQGNLAFALENGMNLHNSSAKEYTEIIETLKLNLAKKKTQPGELIIPQGGACSLSEPGIKILANEIKSFLEIENIYNPVIVLSAGTGTTAYYLKKHLGQASVYAVPCVGSADYLLEQFLSYGPPTNNPKILIPTEPTPFGQPSKRVYEMYKKLLKNKIEFDLLYDSVAWLTIQDNLQLFNDKTIIFVHSGGTQANVTQILRYKRSGL